MIGNITAKCKCILDNFVDFPISLRFEVIHSHTEIINQKLSDYWRHRPMHLLTIANTFFVLLIFQFICRYRLFWFHLWFHTWDYTLSVQNSFFLVIVMDN